MRNKRPCPRRHVGHTYSGVPTLRLHAHGVRTGNAVGSCLRHAYAHAYAYSVAVTAASG